MAIVEKRTTGEKTFDVINLAVLIILAVCFLYPVWYCLAASFSDPTRLISHVGVLLHPDGFSLEGYKAVLADSKVWTGYLNTLFYVGVGVMINMLLTITGAYVLSRKGLMLGRVFGMMIVITMYLNAGMIPNFLLIRNLGLYDSRWSVVLFLGVTTYNLMVMRTAFAQVPAGLEEAAKIDGANPLQILWQIFVPVSKATIAVVALFYLVGHWNAWFTASIFLRSRSKYPLQLYLREILVINSTGANEEGIYLLGELIKYCVIIVATVPILCIYPFVQKFFVQGVMLGSIKG